jgi:HrpA-like RNA helicase
MNNRKLLTVLIVALVISHVLLLFHFLGDRRKSEGPKSIIIERLHLNDDQIVAYEALISQHRNAVNNHETSLIQLRTTLYESLKNDAADTIQTQKIIDSIASLQAKAEQINYAHFQAIKKLCKPEQLKYFNDFTPEFAHLFGPPRHHHPKKD